MQELDLDAVQTNVVEILKAASELKAEANPTAVVGLVCGALTAMSAVYFDMARSLRRTAVAQEELVTIAKLDVEQIINDNIDKGLDDAVDKRLSKRSFLGKGPNES